MQPAAGKQRERRVLSDRTEWSFSVTRCCHPAQRFRERAEQGIAECEHRFIPLRLCCGPPFAGAGLYQVASFAAAACETVLATFAMS